MGVLFGATTARLKNRVAKLRLHDKALQVHPAYAARLRDGLPGGASLLRALRVALFY